MRMYQVGDEVRAYADHQYLVEQGFVVVNSTGFDAGKYAPYSRFAKEGPWTIRELPPANRRYDAEQGEWVDIEPSALKTEAQPDPLPLPDPEPLAPGQANVGEMVKVEWVDIHSTCGWYSPEDAAKFALVECVDLGWVVAQTDTTLTICRSKNSNGDVGDLAVFPRGCITNVEVLDV